MTAPDANLQQQFVAILHAPTTAFPMFHRTFENTTRAQIDQLCTNSWDPYPPRKMATLATLRQPPAPPGVNVCQRFVVMQNPRQSRGVPASSFPAPRTQIERHSSIPIRLFPYNSKRSMILGSPKACPEWLRGRSARGWSLNFSGGARFAPWPAPLALVGLLPCFCHTQVFF
jgi:hypothetical protein